MGRVLYECTEEVFLNLLFRSSQARSQFGLRDVAVDHLHGMVRLVVDDSDTAGAMEGFQPEPTQLPRLPDTHGWRPLKDAPEEIKNGRRFIGGYNHHDYGWQWAGCRYDRHGQYFVMEGGGTPTHYYPLPLPEVVP